MESARQPARARWQAWLLLGLLLLGGLRAEADDQQPGNPPGARQAAPTPEQAADQVLALLTAKDATGLRTLAARRDPDPWLVARELCLRGELDAATALAAAAPKAGAKRLPDYIDACRVSKPDPRLSAVFARIAQAESKRAWAEVVGAVDDVEQGLDDVTRLELRYRRARALRELGKKEATNALLTAAADAHALGWITRAATAYYEAGRSASGRSDAQTARTAFGRALALEQTLGDTHAAARAQARLGLALERLDRREEALRNYKQALDAFEAAGDDSGAASVMYDLGFLQVILGAYDLAMKRFEHARVVFQRIGNDVGRAKALRGVGIVHESRGDYVLALGFYQRAVAILEPLPDKRELLKALSSLASGHYHLGDFRKAESVYSRVLNEQERSKRRAAMSRTLSNLGAVYYKLGRTEDALKFQRRALAIKQELNRQASAAYTLSNMGQIYTRLGNFLKAMAYYDRALEIRTKLKDTRGQATVLNHKGELYDSLGEFRLARGFFKRALKRYEAIGDNAGRAESMLNLGRNDVNQDDLDSALDKFTQALDLMKKAGHADGRARVLLGLGDLHFRRGEFQQALDDLEQAKRTNEQAGNQTGVVRALMQMGRAQAGLEFTAEALGNLDQAAKKAWRLRANALHIQVLGAIARVRLQAGEPKLALAAAKEALPSLEHLLGGLSEEVGASARAQHLDVLSSGTLAAAQLGMKDEMLTFMESGRASLLLESLDGRDALRWDALPVALRNAEADAKAAQARARHEYARAREGGNRKLRGEKARALDDANDQLLAVSARIQREAKREAQIWYPRAATLTEIEGKLAPKTALVLYGLCLDETLALVMTKEGSRIVFLAKSKQVLAAADALDLTQPDSDGTAKLAELRRLLVDPLKLPASVKTVLVSPEGALCYVPFGALFKTEAVAFSPSGTTHLSLLEEDHVLGLKILAMGNPEYGTRVDAGAAQLYRGGLELGALPATRREVEEIGDTILLGGDASEAGFREALKQQAHWLAVHFACHGLVNTKRPTLSSLALTRTGDDDGFLTCLEVLRMKIPANLVVLSACETGRGRIRKGEGIIGLTRTFMYAGAPRVICSLWQVNDAASQVLMLKFYEYWNRGRGESAAAALKHAQEFVKNDKTHPKWKRPHYWAAWVLWGLPS